MPENLSNSTQVALNIERNHSYKIATNSNSNQDDGFFKKTKSIFFSKKKFDAQTIETTKLSRVLTLKDLVCLGVSCTLGSGIYVLAGNVIGEYTGPSVLISFLIAGLCSFLSGLCYAELGSRVPRSGSAYVYIYVTIGEFIAYIIGWDVILEYVIGTSSTASMLSAYIDYLADNKISKTFRDSMPMNSPGVGEYPDFLAFGLCLFITGLLIVGVKESSFLNMIFTALNILIILFIVVAGAVKSNFGLWNLKITPNMSWTDYGGNIATCYSDEDIPDRCGNGGFAPFGFNGVLKGTATCFYAFIGFDAIATTGEEVQNAKKTIPLSIIITLSIVAVSYCSVSAILSLMIPYYQMDLVTPFPQAFEYVGLPWASYVVSVGAITSLATWFPMPRVVYSMASDGLIFKFLGYVVPNLKTPIFACISTGLFAATLSLIFNIEQLVEMMSIGTLMAYSLVSGCTLVLRYKPEVMEPVTKNLDTNQNPFTKIIDYLFGYSEEPLLSRLFAPKSKICSRTTSRLVNVVAIITRLCIMLSKGGDFIQNKLIVVICIFAIIIIVLTFIIFRQPQNTEIKTFKAPLMPFFPLLAIFLNFYLMTTLGSETWLRFFIWFLMGLIVYFIYGIRNSNERINRNQTVYGFLNPIKLKLNSVLRCNNTNSK